MSQQSLGRFARFVEQRVRIADQLAAGVLNGTCIEAYLLVSGVLSAMAAFVWPGDKKDRKRFVELWVRHADSGLRPDAISVPLLSQYLMRKGEDALAMKLESLRPELFGPGEEDRVLTGPEVDVPEREVQAILGQFDVKTIRKFSYANIFYEEVRSFVVHELSLGGNVTSMPMATKPAPVSYSNLLVPGELPDSRREIFFHPQSIGEIARTIAERLDSIPIESSVADPPRWWLDGA